MSSQYTAFNGTVDALTAMMASGTSYATGAKVAIQIATSATGRVRVIEWGLSGSGTAGGAKTLATLAQASTASTMTTAHSQATITPTGDDTTACPLTMSTTACGYGIGAITSATTQRQYAAALLDPAEHYEKQLPLGRDFVVAPSSFLQLRINTAATNVLLAYLVFELC